MSRTLTTIRPTLALLALAVSALAAAPQERGPAPAPARSRESEKLVSLLQTRSYLEAAAAADALLAGPPVDDAGLHAICGLALLKVGRVEAAESLLTRALARDPGSGDAHLGLGRLAGIRNDSPTALRHLKTAVASSRLFDEAAWQLWRLAKERGDSAGLENAWNAVGERCERDGRTIPAAMADEAARFRGTAGLFRLESAPRRAIVPLVPRPDVTVRMVSMRLNGRGKYPIDIDSAAPGFLTLSPLAAEELRLETWGGGGSAIGVGTERAEQRFSRLDRVEFAGVVFRDVPVLVSDIVPFRGQKKGLLGTALLKRFNVTIDVRAGWMDLTAPDRADLLEARIDRSRVAVDVPLYVFDATTVEASIGGAPEGWWILDTAAGGHLVDEPFFGDHLAKSVDPSRIVPYWIRGAQGAQQVRRVEGLPLRLGDFTFENQAVPIFPMAAINRAGGRYAAGLLGNPVLWPYRVHMDFGRGRLILERYRE